MDNLDDMRRRRALARLDANVYQATLHEPDDCARQHLAAIRAAAQDAALADVERARHLVSAHRARQRDAA